MRFTGQFLVLKDDAPVLEPQPYNLDIADAPYDNRSLRAEIQFENGYKMLFFDRRALAKYYMRPCPDDQIVKTLATDPLIAKQAPDWTIFEQSKFPGIAIQEHYDAFSKQPYERKINPRKLVKDYLLSQEDYLAGVGNYVACESMFRARINPEARMGDLDMDKRLELNSAVREVFTAAYDAQCRYDVPGYILVFQKKHCPEGHPIKRIDQGNRGTYFCPTCQGDAQGKPKNSKKKEEPDTLEPEVVSSGYVPLEKRCKSTKITN